ncbi:MAG TPA: ABC transporter ATP-binding protein [Bryobacteraceae bacterium]|nr:ABC transporter ATP-binding protein [Bryobacteraceae bacterium]
MEVISPLLEFRGVAKSFLDRGAREVQALSEVTFSVRHRELVCIIGPSGSGKSTVLRLAAGLASPTSGVVLYRGEPISAPDPERGLVFQAYNAFPWLTVRENVAFGLNSLARNHREARVARWLDAMGLGEFSESYPKALSGGMLQRLALARTLIVEPKLLLLDEPFGALDERTRASMQELLLNIVRETDCTALFVTHDIEEAILLGDRILLLSARPARLLKEFVCPVPKPRTREHLRHPDLMTLYDEILRQFPT